ncbi:hypothetical protein LCGC14_1808790 [marine sediment metagenome]|uniref:Uncharacterized protein n=1 Tax=marine sediment metagenome TaxID=412755 RepID=A0A0F9HAG2_9ZZZZ
MLNYFTDTITPFLPLRFKVRMWRRSRNKKRLLERFFMSKVYRATKHAPWATMHDIVASAVALGTTVMKAANIPSDRYTIGELMNNVELRFSSNDTSTPLTGTARLYGGRKDDDICFIGSLALTTGDQVATSGLFYIHIMTPTSRWVAEMHLADENGNNGISRVIFDAAGYDFIFCLIEFSGSGKEWKIEVSGF